MRIADCLEVRSEGSWDAEFRLRWSRVFCRAQLALTDRGTEQCCELINAGIR